MSYHPCSRVNSHSSPIISAAFDLACVKSGSHHHAVSDDCAESRGSAAKESSRISDSVRRPIGRVTPESLAHGVSGGTALRFAGCARRCRRSCGWRNGRGCPRNLDRHSLGQHDRCGRVAQLVGMPAADLSREDQSRVQPRLPHGQTLLGWRARWAFKDSITG